MSAATVLSVNVGLPKNVEWNGKTVYTGVWKQPVDGPVMVRRLNLAGDGQGDTAGHGGEQRAVLVYQIDSYRYWEQHFGRDDFGYGQFGENLTVDGLPDDEVCIGDRYRIGGAELEVTQPRVTCYRVGLRMGEPELPALLVSHHRPGFYCRVITEGEISAGDSIVKTATGPGALSVSDTDALLYLPDRDQEKLRLAVQIPAMSPGWQGSFRDLLEEAAAPKPAWAGFRPLRVTDVVAETSDVFSVHLAAADGGELPATRAGQYLTFRLPGAVRSYSLSTSRGYRVSVKREPHGLGSEYLTQLTPSSLLDVAAPRGEFVLGGGTEPVLLISAGIGVTPVLAMLHSLAGSSREVWWIHAARRPAEHAFAAEAHELLAQLPGAHEHVYYSAVDGRLTKDKLAGLELPTDATAYVCGPESFMADMQEALNALGVTRIRTELFGALASLNPGVVGQTSRPPHAPDVPGTGPLVTFARSGVSTAMQEGSLLELAEACDVPARWSCRTGVCHNCITPLLSGDLAYSPTPLEPPPDGQALICCSRPTTDLILDM
ncbi:ferredoxin-NADP reductase [Kribbella sp. VKM Ac-2569]|uniref:MOSC and FAD-binding oxidoreductase domain-containing protein n=1 Tax=Kribbella sp. VKM Ac-2569 TaxID=2512220 RepID=UPI00102AEFB3|nr:MOSC and FAD-binding oxidoreductase domain-containing protein [Kribbella sp. VKM Ac-2569]RZT11787.1 ferredoxin-NADP reductase [Kribbella sp. VKM Ac-2569]